MPLRSSRTAGLRFMLSALALGVLAAGFSPRTWASLVTYDSAVAIDSANGLVPVAKLTSAVTLTGANRAAFNFGASSGDATIEFILMGNPAAIATAGYLAVGANTASNLRYEQYNNTGQLGFTQLGVLDYQFSPIVPSPTVPVHIAYVWQSASRTMKLYLNGSIAGTATGVSAAFAMPSGQGWLGANPTGGEAMVGTIHRVTVYDDAVSDALLLRHADAYNDIMRPPILVSFTATPSVLFAPASATLAWSMVDASAVFINGANVTALSNLTVTPSVTTGYMLVATNAGGSVTGRVTVVVNPPPSIHSFTAKKVFVGAGETVTLFWSVSYGQQFSIAPGIGDVTAQTVDGAGSLEIAFAATTNFLLTAVSPFGFATSNQLITLVHPATHLVISEIMAENDSTLPDENGDFSDWIEIYNPTASEVGLSGWFLTDDKSDPMKWAFPNVTLAAGAHLVVFASGKNRANPLAPLHTNFQLDQSGEYLALVGPGPAVFHAFDPAFPPQSSAASYGLMGGDPGRIRFMGVPTPGAANDGTPPPPASVRFSRGSGTFIDAFPLTLTSDDPSAEIRYTLDGSTPSLTNGATYSLPLAIGGTTRLRAVAIASGLGSKITGANFIRLAPDLIGYTSSLPILVIENFGAGVIPQKGWSGTGGGIRQLPRQIASWATFDRGTNGASSLTNPPQMFSRIGIRGRGAFSSSWRQKPYSVEALDERDGERDVAPLGLPAHPDWTLYFPDPDSNKDPSLLFNTFAYDLYSRFGHYGVRFRWVEAFVNEDGGDLRLADRRGIYAIIEKVSRGKDRLDFQRLSAEGTNGGWLLNLNRMDPEPETGWPAANGATQPWFFHTPGPNGVAQSDPNGPVAGDDEPQQSNGYLNFDNPNGYTINTNQRAAIERWFKDFEGVLWNNALWRNPTSGYRKYLDPVDFADYFIMHVLTHNGDGLLISMFPWKGDDGKLRMGPAWDYNFSSYYISGAATADLLWRSDRLWYRRLFTDPDFRQLYIDRWWDHRRGPMSNAGMETIIDGQVQDITPTKAVLNGFSNTANFLAEIARFKSWLTNRATWIDGNYLRPPTFSLPEGDVPDGSQLSLFGTNGTVYYTIDGADPRASGGAIADSAQTYSLPLSITTTILVQARLRNGTNWSGLTRGTYRPPQDLSKLVLTEIMFNPPAVGATNGDEFEFIEFKNSGSVTQHLGTLTFNAGINFTFPANTRLAPGQFFVLARNPAAFASKYPGVPVNGLFTGRLDNGGETLRLATPFGATVLAVTYNNRAPWAVASDGYGFSLVPRNAPLNPNSDNGAQWRASSAVGGSPGGDDPEPGVPPVFINEAMTHTDLPALDWIELFNPNHADVNLGGWFLSDDGALPRKFRIPAGTMIPAGGYVVLTEADFNAPPLTIFSFSLDSAGDSIYLASGDAGTNLTGWSHAFAFGASANGVTFGRHLNSVGAEQFPAQVRPTPGTANSGPSVGPVVLTEIHYHPDVGGAEFLELRNLMADDLLLFDALRPTNTWRVNGLGYFFPTNLLLPAGGTLLIVATTPTVFRAKYGVGPEVQVIGPFPGSLQDSGERLELQRPDAPDTNGVPYITVDEVRYNDRAPWPPAADGSGASLQRKVAAAYGNDPANWSAALPTPGSPFVSGDAPVITLQPVSQSVVGTGNAMFSTAATGGVPFFFQWLFNGSLIAGATNATLVLPRVGVAQAGRYSAVVFNQAGSVETLPALLTVLAPPLIITQPRDVNVRIRPDPAAALTTNATFTIAATSGSSLSYQWRFNGTNLPGATGDSFTVTNVQLTHQGAYDVALTDANGTSYSAPAALTPLITPLFVQPPLSQSLAIGGPVTLSASIFGSPAPFTYLWRRSSTFLTTNTTSATNTFFSFTATNVPASISFNVVVRNQANSSPGVLSATATVTTLADNDGDGLPDAWETQFGLNPANPADGSLDTDEDGMSNRAEYVAGTDPKDPLSYLRVEVAALSGAAMIQFGAVSNRTYTVQFTDALPSASWSRLADLLARTNNHVEFVPDPGWTTNRFYRLVTPKAGSAGVSPGVN